MKNYFLTKIFLDVYNTPHRKKFNLEMGDPEEFEGILKDYIRKTLGARISNDCDFYCREIKTAFENIFTNAKLIDLVNIRDFIISYGDKFINQITQTSYSSNFINTMRRVYDNDAYGLSIKNIDKCYIIMRNSRKNEEGLPPLVIKDIDKFEVILNNFITQVVRSKTLFNSFFAGLEEEEAISYLFEWTIRNAGYTDLSDVQNFYRKYTYFIVDDTFEELETPMLAGKIGDNELYIRILKANVNYETPYYLSFIVANGRSYTELPNVRLGIEKKLDRKVAHILAVQSTQARVDYNKTKEINAQIKEELPKSKYFREFNPSHLASITISCGLLKGLNISNIDIVDYLPLRYRRLLLENHKNDEEINNLQYRLTNKNINSFLKLCEISEGINISNYPDLDGYLRIELTDTFDSKSKLLVDLYNMGYNIGNEVKIKNEEKEKQKIKGKQY